MQRTIPAALLALCLLAGCTATMEAPPEERALMRISKHYPDEYAAFRRADNSLRQLAPEDLDKLNVGSLLIMKDPENYAPFQRLLDASPEKTVEWLHAFAQVLRLIHRREMEKIMGRRRGSINAQEAVYLARRVKELAALAEESTRP